MGAHTVTFFAKTDLNLHDAWNHLYHDERSQHGSDPYSGTFATCNGVQLAGEPMGLVDAETAAEAILSGQGLPARLDHKIRVRNTNKWGPALALPVLDESDAKRATRTVTIDHHEDHLSSSQLLGLAYDRLELPRGAWLGRPEIVNDKTTTRSRVQRATGPTRTVYVLEGRGVRTGAQEYPNEREAIKAAKDILNEHLERGWHRHGETITVNALRKKGETPTVIGLDIVKRRTTIKVPVLTPGKTAGTCGWYFFAWAAS